MKGLHDAFDQEVADIPVYGDLDQAIEQAGRDRRRRYTALAGVSLAAAVLAVLAGIVVASRDADTAPPVTPSPTPVTPTPTPEKSQSPRTWADTALPPAHDGADWVVPDPLTKAREGWFAVVADHLDPAGGHLEPMESYPWGGQFERPSEDSIYSTFGRMGLMVDRGRLNLFDDGCAYLAAERAANLDESQSCRTERFAGPHGEPARIATWDRECGPYDGDASAYEVCGDYVVAVAVQRRDGTIGYVAVDGRGTAESNPFSRRAMAAAAADPELSLPETAFTVPSNQTVVSVLESHFPGYRTDHQTFSGADHPGYGYAWGRLGKTGLVASVWPAGNVPSCGRRYLLECVERRVFGAEDSTTVYVGAWDEEDWASSPKNSRLSRREFVYVGPRHTVVVRESRVARQGEDSVPVDLDQRIIDLLLDPRLQ